MMPSESLDLLPDSILHRRTMVDRQIRTFDVTDAAVIARFLDVPREIFLPAQWRGLAYSDNALEVSADAGHSAPRQLLPPLILARLIQNASIKAGERILDVAAGTGYSTAILAGLVQDVTALESDQSFLSLIGGNLRSCGIVAQVVAGALEKGAPSTAPYDVIFVNGAVEAELETLFAQLKEGGRLLSIQHSPEISGGHASKAVRFEKIAGEISARFLFDASAAVLPAFRKAPQFVF